MIRDGTYASFDENDINRYKAFLPAMWKANSRSTNPAYDVVLEAVDELKSPSAKSRIDIYASLLDKSNDFRIAETTEAGSLDTKMLYDPISYARENYNKLAVSLVDKSSSRTKMYLEEVKRLGYNALVDDNDAGRLTKSPIMILDSKSVLKKSQTILTKADKLKAVANIKPMAGESLDSTKRYLKKGFMKKLMELVYFNAYYTGMTNPTENLVWDIKNPW